MKKSVKLGITFILIVWIMVGCRKNFLEVQNPNQITEDLFWKNENDVLAALASVYSPLRIPLSGYWGAFNGFQDINAMGDDVYTIPGEEPATWQVATFIYDSKNSDLGNIFDKLYKAIYRANLLIDNVDKVLMEEDKKKMYKAEVKFLRGLCYFTLASNYGSVPLKIASTKTAEDNFPAGASEQEVWNQAINDLTEAKNGLPAGRTATEQGRATSGAALAFLGKTYLYMKDYAKAESTLDLLTKAPYHYELLDNFEDNFTDRNEFNSEAVFQWVYGDFGDPYSPWGEEGKNAGMYNYIPQFIGTPKGGGWFKYVPSAYFVDQFFKELRVAGSDTKFDKRMYASLAWKYTNFDEPDVTWYNNQPFDALWGSALPKIKKFAKTDYPLDTLTHGKFLIKKFTNSYRNEKDADNYWGAKPSKANYVIIRYAEVLLMRAEAAARNGNTDVAIRDINAIRKRAGLIDKTSIPDIMEEISHQKLLELFMEQNRWNDLKRWFTPEKLKLHFATVKKQGDKQLEPKHYKFPIPAGELLTNPNIKQNPLWQ